MYSPPKKIFTFLTGAVMSTLVFGMIYAAVQQDMRMSANDPQIQIAEDTATYLNSAGDMQSLAGQYDQVDFGQSLAPFIIVYDAHGTPLLSTGTLDGDVPTVPPGVLTYATVHGEDHLTWQPSSTTRVATVVVPYVGDGSGGYILVGRNLREVEKRELSLEEMVFVGWALSLVLLALICVIPMVITHLSHE